MSVTSSAVVLDVNSTTEVILVALERDFDVVESKVVVFSTRVLVLFHGDTKKRIRCMVFILQFSERFDGIRWLLTDGCDGYEQ